MSLGMVQLLFILFQFVWTGIVYGKTINVNPSTGNDSKECLGQQIPCSSLDYALSHLQNGDCVNITSDTVSLPRTANLSDRDAITIRGQGNTIVMCNNTGGMSCNNCSDIVIEGITWDQCGDPNQQNRADPDAFGGLNFTNVTNLSINNCTLQHSRVRALSLNLMSGSININNTQFLNNANDDTIHCFQGPVYIHCVTDERNVTGAVYIQDATSETNISISNCSFSNNGHFGEVTDSAPTNTIFEQSEIADGAAIKVLQANPITVPINIAVEHSSFLNNRGRSGGAVNINISQSQNIKFNNVEFLNNSVIQFYVNSSALFVFLRNTSFTVLQLSKCSFQCNNEGRNVIGYIVAGEPSNVLISNCTFSANKQYDVGLVELNVQSQSMVDFTDSQFANNTGNALLYVQLRSINITVSLHGLHITNNTGSSVLRRGGLLSFRLFEDNCKVNITRLMYTMNSFARNGGGLYITGFYRTVFRCYVQDACFESNIGRGQGAVIFSILQSDSAYVFTIYNSTFRNNTGRSIVRIGKISLMEDLVLTNVPSYLFLGQSTKFLNNSGTPIRLSNVILVGNGNTEFRYNVAQSGAALHLTDSYVLPYISSFQYNFFHNFAIVRGGAIFLDFSTNLVVVRCAWLLYQLANSDSLCNQSSHVIRQDCPRVNGQLLCSEIQQQPADNGNPQLSPCYFNYTNNSASVAGSTIFYNVPTSTPVENSSNPNSIFYIPKDHCMNNSTSPRRLATQPYKLKLEAPATCLDDNCTTYFLNGITLGQEIRIPAKIIGYNNESAEATVFFITCVENCSSKVIGRLPVLINDQLSGIHIIGGKKVSTTSVKLQLSSDTITLNLTVGLTSCSPGFVYDSTTRQCECFTTDDIISCSPNTTIQRDHWFGVVDGITTVSVCPNGYCNFGDEVTSGRFLLSAIQDDQCNSQRTGPACGECDPGYTLSYDSIDCVNIDDCHYKYIVAVILGTLLYWILLIISVFALMWLITKRLEYCNGIGYLYGFIYYYSIADILLGRILSFSDGLSKLVSVLSIFFKLNPGFDLFNFCFVRGMQRIDQYIINYIHPTIILLFLLLLVLLAKTKYAGRLRLTGEVMIPIICLILTIAYTSIADTSLQLLRYIDFTGVDGAYVYLSPSIGYFTGRHVVYFFIALLYELVIVAGLPLLLILSRWTNKINLIFVRIDMKPIFDQFQGCYKDKYRWFAAIYLICRQVILIIVVIDFTDYYIELYLLAIVCLVTATLHYSVQPYENDILNKIDGILLQLLLLIVSLQMVAFSNGFTVNAVEGVAYTLLLLPIFSYILAMLCYLCVFLLKQYWLAKKHRLEPHYEVDLDLLTADTAVDDQHAVHKPAARFLCATYPGPLAQPGVNSNESELQKPLLQNQLAATEFGRRYI